MMNNSTNLSRFGKNDVSVRSVVAITTLLSSLSSCGNVAQVGTRDQVPVVQYPAGTGLLSSPSVSQTPVTTPTPNLPYELDEERAELATMEPDHASELHRSHQNWESCGDRLLRLSGLTGRSTSTRTLTRLYQKHSVQKDDLFLRYVVAVMYVESRFNARAISEKEAYGLMQMTRPAVLDAQKSCNLRAVGEMDELLDSATNVRYGSCYLRQLLQETGGDWTRTLVAYNGGFRQLRRLDQGRPMVKETTEYVVRIQEALDVCSDSGISEATN